MEASPGCPFSYDYSRATDYCDLILGAWMPEQEPGIDRDELDHLRDQLKLRLLKNRYGPEATAHLIHHADGRVGQAERVLSSSD